MNEQETQENIGVEHSLKKIEFEKNNFGVEDIKAEVEELENKMREGQAERDSLVEQNKTLEAKVNELKVKKININIVKSVSLTSYLGSC